jgi:hypothetical protein
VRKASGVTTHEFTHPSNTLAQEQESRQEEEGEERGGITGENCAGGGDALAVIKTSRAASPVETEPRGVTVEAKSCVSSRRRSHRRSHKCSLPTR